MPTKDPIEISIILPFYNAEETLRAAVESMLNQSFTPFELILVDNNSDDTSVEIAQKLIQKDSRCILIKEKQQGIAFALNAGLAHCQGQYIARMDADDISLPHRLQQQYRFLEDNPGIDVVAGKAKYRGSSSETKGFERYVRWSNSIKSSSQIALNRFVESPIIHPTVMWRTEVSNTYGAYQHGSFPEDYELWLRWMDRGVQLCQTRRIL